MTVQTIDNNDIYTIDLNFNGIAGAIACYLTPHQDGAVLIECGPGSTIPHLVEGIENNGFIIDDITDVLLTHIHLDHAGAAGWLSRQGATIHVHPVGAPHMKDPKKLIASATRIYGDMMDTLWGEFLPVRPQKLNILTDGEDLSISNLNFHPVDTPGHANHHYVYFLDKLCFSGDIGGVRLTGTHHIRVPMPPPEFILESWQDSVGFLIKELSRGSLSHIAPTHFGIFSDQHWHLSSIKKTLTS